MVAYHKEVQELEEMVQNLVLVLLEQLALTILVRAAVLDN